MSEEKAAIRFVEVPGWPKPKGFANGVVTGKRTLFVAGQIGWNERQELERDLARQFAQALDNVLAVVRAAGGAPESVVKMTVYVTDLAAYRVRSEGAIGAAWRERFGRHFPVMALVGVAGLVEEGALVEIETTCCAPRRWTRKDEARRAGSPASDQPGPRRRARPSRRALPCARGCGCSPCRSGRSRRSATTSSAR